MVPKKKKEYKTLPADFSCLSLVGSGSESAHFHSIDDWFGSESQ